MIMLPIYLSFIVVSILCAFEHFSNGRSYKIIYYWIVMFFLVLLASFRSIGVGSDDQAYMFIFHGIPSLLECESFLCGYSYSIYNIEFGFFWFLSLLLVFSSSQYWLFFSVAFASVCFNLKSIRYFSPYAGASVVVYFTHFFLAKELNAIRLGLATAILFYAACFLTKCRYSMMFFLFAIAVSLHVSSIIFLMPVVVYLLSPNRSVFVFAGITSLLLAWLFDLGLLFNSLAGFGFIGEKISLYLSAEEYNYALPIFDVVNIKNLLVCSISLLFWNQLLSRYDWFKISFCFFYSATMFRILFGDFAILAGRGYSVISMFEYVLIPCLACFFLGRGLGYIVVFIYSFLTLWLNLTINAGWSGGVNYFHDFL
ncbi:EpsG family protein [Pseudomonas sp. Ga0074129]|uniref:EpsG family protein n=1 Tax=Pseudomonas sp. Ga0074129 TaxID=1752219 RepID=UPI000AFD34B8|nr:EpsG family protein [Pseudomonas sp. Ga0074129]